MARPAVGQEAPDFELPSSAGGTLTLSALRGRTVALCFYPGDRRPHCTRQLKDYSQHWDDLQAAGIDVVAVSRQDLQSHRGFIESCDLRMPLLSDAARSVAKRYGVAMPFGQQIRAIFLIDPAGVIRDVWRSTTGIRYLDAPQLIARARSLSRASEG